MIYILIKIEKIIIEIEMTVQGNAFQRINHILAISV